MHAEAWATHSAGVLKFALRTALARCCVRHEQPGGVVGQPSGVGYQTQDLNRKNRDHADCNYRPGAIRQNHTF